MANYQHTSLDAMTAVIAARLADSNFTRWLRDEIDLLLFEALRTWNSLTGTAYTVATGSVTANAPFQDKAAIFPVERGYTVKDSDLVALISYHLWEPKSTSAWVGSERFTLAEITAALQQRRDQFLLDTGCVVTHSSPYPAAPAVITPSDGAGAIALGTSIMDIRRAAWRDAENTKVSPLWNSGHWSLRGANRAWNRTPSLPRAFVYNQRGPITIQLAPPPVAGGTLDLLVIQAGATLNPAAGVVLGIQDDFAPYIKWGALADLFGKDGPARDYARALYCERMYQRGVQIAKREDQIIEARCGNIILQPSSIERLDQSVLNWQNKTAARPSVMADCGLNLFALYPVPDQAYGVEFTMIRNMPLPDQANRTGTYLQLGKEYLDIIAGYVVHLALLKVGGQEFAATSQFAEIFFKAAQDYVDRPGAAIIFPEDDLNTPKDIEAQQQSTKKIQRETGATLR